MTNTAPTIYTIKTDFSPLPESATVESYDSVQRATEGCYIYLRMLPTTVKLRKMSLLLLANMMDIGEVR